MLLWSIFVAALLYFIKSRWLMYWVGTHIPGPEALPLLGNIRLILKFKMEYLFLTAMKYRDKYGTPWRLWFGPQLWVFLHSAKEATDVLNDLTTLKPAPINEMKVLIGNGLLSSHGNHWWRHRRLLAPVFEDKMLIHMIPEMAEQADRLVSKLAKTSERVIEVNEFLFPCVLDTIMDTCLSKNINSQNIPNCQYTKAYNNISELLFKRMANPLLNWDFIYKWTSMCRRLKSSVKIIHTVMDEAIFERMSHIKEQLNNTRSSSFRDEQNRVTFLDTLLTAKMNGRPLTLQEIRDEVNTFVYAGVDATTAAMSFILFALAKHPDQQQKIYEEIKDISPLLSDGVNESQFSKIENSPCLDMFVKECMRFYTIVPMTGRVTTCDTYVGDKHYCAGITLWINNYDVAHNAELFERPFEFRPERFSLYARVGIPKSSYIVFTNGPHKCSARNYAPIIMKVLTMKILEKFVVQLRNPNEELKLMAKMVLKSKHGINLIFKKR